MVVKHKLRHVSFFNIDIYVFVTLVGVFSVVLQRADGADSPGIESRTVYLQTRCFRGFQLASAAEVRSEQGDRMIAEDHSSRIYETGVQVSALQGTITRANGHEMKWDGQLTRLRI